MPSFMCYSPLLKNTCVRQVVLDKCFPLKCTRRERVREREREMYIHAHTDHVYVLRTVRKTIERETSSGQKGEGRRRSGITISYFAHQTLNMNKLTIISCFLTSKLLVYFKHERWNYFVSSNIDITCNVGLGRNVDGLVAPE